MSFNRIAKTLMISSACGLLLGAGVTQASDMPKEINLSGLDYDFIGRDDLYTYKSLDKYAEAPFLTELVKAGKLPALKDRLPSEPLVFKTGAMSDGVGQYGGVFRHVIGGRPEGWNWLAGETQGWGGINIAVQECLVRQGPRWQIKAEDQTAPLPNLAKAWEWNEDKTELTMHLIEGAKWSDGDEFDSEDIRFWWEDNVEDKNVSSRMAAGSLAKGAKLTIIDKYTFKFNFDEPQSETLLESLAYIQGCPGPSHVLKNNHPRYNPEKTYDDYVNAMPADALPIPVMGAWTPVLHKPDELVVMRRNPFYWKVDEAGNQLPYFNEMHFKLTSWEDRTTQAIAGTGDFSNLESPGNFVEALKQSKSPDSPVSATFGPRINNWRIDLNYSNRGAEDDVDLELRELFRMKDFRVALSHALDRKAIGQALARGPFTYVYPAGFASGSPYYDVNSTVYYEFSLEKAGAILDSLNVKDTDGNGIRNLPKSGKDITIDIQFGSENNEARKQLEAVTSQFADIGIRVLPKGVDKTSFENVRYGGAFNALIRRVNNLSPTRETCEFLPVGENCPNFHRPDDNGRVLQDFEKELLAAYQKFVATPDKAEKVVQANKIQKLVTENVYYLGTVQYPAALLINKRVKNAHPGTPVFMYEWAEDAVIRERLWTPSELQLKELLPNTVAEFK